MGAAAEFHGFGLPAFASHSKDTHGFAVFLAEQGHGPSGQGFLARHFARGHRQIGHNGAVDVAFHGGQLLRGQGRNMRKVET